MKVVGVISDTHGLLRPAAVAALRGVDLIVHAGDIGTPAVIDALDELGPVFAVRGNMDHGVWADRFPTRQVVEVEGDFLYVLHDVQQLDLAPAAAGFKVVIFGHSHSPSTLMKQGVLYLNPGSAGPRRFRLPVTVAKLRVGAEEPVVEIIRLPG